MRVLGFRVQGFRGLGFSAPTFRDVGFRVSSASSVVVLLGRCRKKQTAGFGAPCPAGRMPKTRAVKTLQARSSTWEEGYLPMPTPHTPKRW